MNNIPLILEVMKNLTYSILKLPQTVFSAREIAIILRETNLDIVKSKINYYVKRGELFALRRGIYSKDPKFSEFEFATKLYTPSYISFETVLSRVGVVFQYDSRIHTASYLNRELEVSNVKIYYRKIKSEILNNPLGIIYKNNYPEAILERAFLDTIYVNGLVYFDNVDLIDFDKCEGMLSIYEGAITKKDLQMYANNK